MIELNNYWWEDEKRKGQEIGEKMKGRTWKKRTGRRGKEGGREEARGKKKNYRALDIEQYPTQSLKYMEFCKCKNMFTIF